ncbi:MAG: hypothetical protein H0U39_00415 [Segetibacter sp.]|nr:hypothetical protein [Segetibacter sp.]
MSIGFRITVKVWGCGGIENRQPVTEAKFINKSALFVLLLNVIPSRWS